MVVRRERLVSAPPAEVWRIVSDPTRLAAWWPGVTRVEEASREAWTTVLVLARGQGGARRLQPARGRGARARRCGATRSRSRPSSGSCPSRPPRSRWRPTRAAGRACSGHARPAAARLGALQPVPAARRREEAGARPRSTASADLLGGRRADALVGLGRGRARRPAAARRRGAAARGARAWTPGRGSTPSRSSEVPLPGRRGCRQRRASGWPPPSAPSSVRDDRETRVAHARRAARYPDLVRIRSGDASSAPDAVVAAGVRRAGGRGAGRLRRARRGRGAVRRRHERRGRRGAACATASPAAISLDLGRLAATVDVDRTSLTARLDAGLFGPEAERRLGEEGVTLGHFPQSFEYSTVGGWVATRSAGPGLDRLRADRRARRGAALRDAGGRARHARPRRRRPPGPSLRELLVGSEGVLGVICEATLRVRPAPAGAPLRGLVVRRLRRGLRRVPRDGAGRRGRRRRPALRRGRDAATMALGSTGSTDREARQALPAACAATRAAASRSSASRASEEDVERPAPRGPRRCCGPAAAWRSGTGPATRGSAAATRRPTCATSCSTAACSSRRSRPPRAGRTCEQLHGAVGEALRTRAAGRGTPPLVMCHVSHLYPSGASLYFTFLARQEEDAARRSGAPPRRAASRGDRRAAAARSRTTTRSGATTASGCAAEVGELGIEVLRAAKERLDPAGIMNPGKLLP